MPYTVKVASARVERQLAGLTEADRAHVVLQLLRGCRPSPCPLRLKGRRALW